MTIAWENGPIPDGIEDMKNSHCKPGQCHRFRRESDALMSYASPIDRAALIAGFRALADYLEANPEVPAPSYSDVYTFPPDGECAEMRAEIEAIAELLGNQAREEARRQHYTVTRSFGPVEYRAVAICKHHHHDNAPEVTQ